MLYDQKEILLYAGESTGDIVEYQIDVNTAIDSDGDGDPANDVDNKDHQSVRDGSVFSIPVENPNGFVSRLTIVDAGGEMSTSEIEFTPGESTKNNPLYARISSLPPANKDGDIFLLGDTAEVTFAFFESEGNIIQYRLDENTLEDSDGDGDTTNDMDNKDDPSFTSGAPLTLSFSREAQEETTLRFVAVAIDEDGKGKGSALERNIRFIEKTPVSTRPTIQEMSPQIIVNKEEADVEEEIEFYVLGVPVGAEYAWDFDGDGEPDNIVSESMIRHSFSSAGEYAVGLTVAMGDQQQSVEQEIIINDPQPVALDPVADFSFEQAENTFSFTNASVADPNLEDNTLSFLWDFGDGSTSEEQNPEHEYSEVGEYTVSLSVTDSGMRSSEMKKNISLSPEDIPEPTSDTLTTADFSFEQAENTFSFTNASVADPNLEDNTLSFLWDFGDGSTSEEQNPEHEYSEVGEYTVSLSVTDSEGITAEKQIIITISGATGETPVEVPVDQEVIPPQKQGASFPWGKLLLVLLIAVFGGIGITLFIKKVESPDLGFGEIIREEMERWMDHIQKKQKVSVKSKEKHAPETSSATEKPDSKKPNTEVVNAPSPFLSAKKNQTPEEKSKKEDDSPTQNKPSSSAPKSPFLAANASKEQSSPENSLGNEQNSSVQTNETTKKPSDQSSLPDDSAPDWLKNLNSAPIPADSEQQQEKPFVEPGDKKDDIPDWLRGSATPSPEPKTSESEKPLPEKSETEKKQQSTPSPQNPQNAPFDSEKDLPKNEPQKNVPKEPILKNKSEITQAPSPSQNQNQHPQDPSVPSLNPEQKSQQQGQKPEQKKPDSQPPLTSAEMMQNQKPTTPETNQKPNFQKTDPFPKPSSQATTPPMPESSQQAPNTSFPPHGQGQVGQVAPKEENSAKPPVSQEKKNTRTQNATPSNTNVPLSSEQKIPTQNTPAPQEQSKTNIPEKSQQKEEKSDSQNELSGEAILSADNLFLDDQETK
jgi:PKD repeat protein